jgi:hypothetical protein
MTDSPTAPAPDTVPLLRLPEGTRVRYTYTAPEGQVTIQGVKGRPVGDPRLGNQGYMLVADDGTEIPVSRYAAVEVVPRPT